MLDIKFLNKQKIYTANQLRTLPRFKGKFLNVHALYINPETGGHDLDITIYEVRAVSKVIRENFNTVEDILNGDY